ncbi:MAG: hypothetical protein H6837_13250 [Planctomycetes bacterium]|nr:hypothetical protein [Planctomycetota bacterium]
MGRGAPRAGFALKVDPNSAEARDLFTRAQEFLGEKRVNQISSQESAILRWQVQQTRDEARATTAAQVGDAQMAAGRFSSAVESYERAVTILKCSPFHSSGSALFTQLSAKLEDAKKARTSAMAAKVDQDRKGL